MITTDQIQGLTTVVGSGNDKIGKVGQVYLDDQTGQPEWVTVNTGMFGKSESFVPLGQATADGSTLRVPYTKDTVKGAPRVAADGHLEESEEDEMYRYYGLEGDQGTGTDRGRDERVDHSGDPGVAGRDVSSPTTDTAMTRSDEELRVGVQRREAGRARLRKYVTTEQQTVEVPVTREQVRVEREPITDANAGDAMDGPAISEEEHEVVLHEDVPVVATEARPVERVRLDTETVTEEEQVTGEVRKEHIEVDGPEGTGKRL